MKRMILLLSLPLTFFTACNNESNDKDSLEKADSANKANADSSSNRNNIIVDEESSSFLTRVANSGMAEVEMTSLAGQKATYPSVKNFAHMLHNDHMALNDQVKSLAAQKNVVLPATITDEKQKDIDNLKKVTGKDFDRDFIKKMIDNHRAGIDMFQKATENAKDADVKAFAEKVLPTLKMHLDSAKAIQKKYW